MRAFFGKRVVFVVLLVAVPVMIASLSFATKGFVYDQAYAHEGSEAYADNGQDFSRLQSCCATPDNIGQVIDKTCNGYDARARYWDHGEVIRVIRDDDGCSFGGGHYGFGHANLNAHDTCTGMRNGSLFGCGPNSGHGG